MKSNRQFYLETCERAKVRSQSPGYEGCSVHVNARVQVIDGEPKITDYLISDWFVGDSTVATFVNGERRD